MSVRSTNLGNYFVIRTPEVQHKQINKKTAAAAAAAAAAKSFQSCPTLCDPIDVSPPGSPVPGILQARTLEWGVIASFKLEDYIKLKASAQQKIQPAK